MFNSEEYGWNDITIFMLGRPVLGARAMQYKEAQDKENVYGKGRKPIGRSRGNVEYDGSMTVLFSELRALLIAEGVNSPNDLRPFDITVSYAPEAGGVITTDTLKFVEFMEVDIDWSQGDKMKEVPMPIIIGDIEYNV